MTTSKYVFGARDQQYAVEVRYILLCPLRYAYDAIKEELLKHTQISQKQRLCQLLTQDELGDRMPSQLLQHMQQLLGDAVIDDTLLRKLIVQRLPSGVQMVIASTLGSMSITQLAELADRIVEVSVQNQALPALVSEVSADSSPLADLQAQVAALTTAIADLTRHRSHCANSPSRSSSPAHSNSQWCYYLQCFGSEARKCQQPCTFHSENKSPRA